MPERTYAAVLFDMDGVLLDSVGMYERHWRRWAARNGIEPEAPIAVHHGHSAIETITIVAPHLDARAEATDYNRGISVDAAIDGLTTLPGAHEAIAAIPDRRWAVATSASHPIAQRCLAGVGVDPPVLVGIEDVERGKPAPDPYRTAAERLGVDPGDCLVIEDAPPGIAAGLAAGCDVIALMTTHEPSALQSASAVVADLAALRFRPANEASRVRLTWDYN